MRFLILGGTEKAGTTAMFSFFYGHPHVNPSLKKETDFFRTSGPTDLSLYIEQFHKNGGSIFFEASPGYLADSDNVINRIQRTIHGHSVFFVFILRDPVERLVSSFGFHKSRGYIHEHVTFNDYIDSALRYNESGFKPREISTWALESVFHGEYAEHLRRFLEAFQNSVLVIDYDLFKKSPQSAVDSICKHVSLDTEYFRNFHYFEANKTFKPRFRLTHSLLLRINGWLAPFFYRQPRLKQLLLRVYKRVNRGHEDTLSSRDCKRAISLYTPSVRNLILVLKQYGLETPSWTDKYR